MDTETLANHIIHLGKQDFKILCSIVLHDVLELQVFCVDGKGDGGTDFISLAADGTRQRVAYQITTQKTDIINKAYNDAKKSIEKLMVNHYFFLPTYNISETEARKLEFEISSELGIPATVYSPRTMAEFLIQHKQVRKFFELTGIVDGINQSKESVDYLERALHTYTLLSSDARNLKSQIYDDTLLYLLSDTEAGKEKTALIDEAMTLLHLSESKQRILNGRVDALMQKGIIKKTISNTLKLSPSTEEDITLRKILYKSEQGTFYAAQVDILRAYDISWDLSDSTQSSVWIANDIIFQQISGLKSAGAAISNPFFKNVRRNGLDKLRKYLTSNKKVSSQKAEDIVKKMVSMAARHPLVVKIVRASVYISLEGTKPLAAAKSLGVNSWDEVMLLIEPTFEIPNLCSQLYEGTVNAYFDNAVSALKRAWRLGIKMFIPFYYIKECAGHLLLARHYDGLELSSAEMQFSKNAFVANYYALKEQNVSMPSSFIDYLATFSTSIKTEHIDHQVWIRDITTDLQSLFFHMGVEFLEIPQYLLRRKL